MKKGFTLAEILITLGIIGVVAAITLPQLIYNYQKKTWVEGLKIGVSTLEQGFKKALADDGVDDLRDTELFKVCDGNSTPGNIWARNCQPILKKYFIDVKFEDVDAMRAQGDSTNIITDTAKCKQLVGKTNKWWYLNDKTKCRGWKNMAVTLSNGMRADIVFEDYGHLAGSITALDINGGKGPNTWGRDTFYLLILKDGHVVGFDSSAHAKANAEYNNVDFETVYNSFKTQREAKCSKTTTEDGTSCSGRVIDEGWVMNY